MIAVIKGRVSSKNSVHVPKPKASPVSSTSVTVVTAAEAMARQFPLASRQKGTRMPSCGLTVSSPNNTPARIGRFGAANRPPISSAAVNAPFWPKNALMATAGEKTAATWIGIGRRSGRMAPWRRAIVPKVQTR